MPRFGARCDRALAAATFDALPLRLLRNTFDAAFPAFAEVLRFLAIYITSSKW
ncbi:MAG TPA: hypothetical protein VFF07_00385 [Actinomycetota bacterium]|nr:hypothetical protein [Actinomycetota bacterium]